MRKIIIFIIISCLLACNEDNTPNEDNNPVDRETFLFLENSMITVQTFEEDNFSNIESGQNLVFIYSRYTDPFPDSIDDESTVRLIFEIDAELDSFQLNSTELIQQNANYSVSNSEFFSSSTSIEGFISGSRINKDSWQISIDINAALKSGLIVEMTVDELFKRQQQN